MPGCGSGFASTAGAETSLRHEAGPVAFRPVARRNVRAAAFIMPKYQLAIFDSDGTLADTLPWFRNAYNGVAARHGIPPLPDGSEEELRRLTSRELLARLKVPLWRLPGFIRGMRQLMAEHLHEFSLFEGIAPALHRLAANDVAIGLVSSNSWDNVRAILGPETATLVRYEACGASLFGKAAKLREVLRASRVPKQSAIYIGDEARDAEAAHKAGIAYGAVAWGCHALEILRPGAAETFERPREIAEKLLG